MVPSPKVQRQLLIRLALRWVNCTVSGAEPESGVPVNSAPGYAVDVGITNVVGVRVGVAVAVWAFVLLIEKISPKTTRLKIQPVRKIRRNIIFSLVWRSGL